MDYDYYSRKNGTIANRVDYAWKVYQDKNTKSDDKQNAQRFLVHAFNIRKIPQKENELENILVKLMNQRQAQKAKDPNYVPKNTLPCQAGFVLSDNEDIRLKVDKATLDQDKKHQVDYLTKSQRDEYKLEIKDGLFYKNGEIYDCNQFKHVAHQKPGWAAFTLNLEGELSAFPHGGGVKLAVLNGKELRHSSMNAGADVWAAGQMEIKNGKLIRIDTNSGHYKPTLLDLYRFLEYLDKKGVDISNTTVELHREIKNLAGVRRVPCMFEPIYEVPAKKVYQSLNLIIERNIKHVDEYLNSPKTKIKNAIISTQSSEEKITLMKSLKADLAEIRDIIGNTESPFGLKTSLALITKKLENFESQYQKISSTKEGRLKVLFKNMKYDIHCEKIAVKDEEKINNFKNCF